jgi:hypothetical protein
MDDQKLDTAMKYADAIVKAIAAKFPKYEPFVRRHATGENGYIKLSLRPEGGTLAQEKTMAYADEFFLSITPENKNEKAKIIYQDFKQMIKP